MLLLVHLVFVAGSFYTAFSLSSVYDARRNDSRELQSPRPAVTSLLPWACVPIAILTSFLLLNSAISHLEPSTSSDLEFPAPSGVSHTFSLILVVVYCTLLVVSICNLLLFSSQPKFIAAATSEIATEVMVILTYLQMLYGTMAGRAWFLTAFSRVFHPLRINLWGHSTIAQLLIFSSSPRVLAVFSWTDLISVQLLVVCLFYLSFLFVLPPPNSFGPRVEMSYIATLAVATFTAFFRVTYYVHRFLTISLGIPFAAHPTIWTKMFMKLLHAAVLCSWTAFPVVYLLGASNLISFEQEAFLFTLCDMLAKAITSILLHSGTFVSFEAERQWLHMLELHEQEFTVRALQMFTKSLGHDLRNPLQALVLCNERAQREIDCLVATHGLLDRRRSAPSVSAQLTASSGGEVVAAGSMAAGSESLTTSDRIRPTNSNRTVDPAASAYTPRPLSASGMELAQEVEASALETLRQRLHEMEASVELLTCIVSNVWDLEKIVKAERQDASLTTEANTAMNEEAMNEEAIDINGLIESVTGTLKLSSAHKSSVAIQVLPDTLIPKLVWGDRSWLVRILLNLLVNAMKFTDRGHITLRTTCLSPLPAQEVRVRFDVIDTGRGMDEDQIAECVKPYIHCSERLGGGLGLGLTIISKAVHAMGGTLNINSAPGQGAEFSVVLAFKTRPPSPSVSSGSGGVNQDNAESLYSAFAEGVTARRHTTSSGPHRPLEVQGPLQACSTSTAPALSTTQVPSPPSAWTPSVAPCHSFSGNSDVAQAPASPTFRTQPHRSQYWVNECDAKRVMVVDDVDMIREGASMLLLSMGHKVVFSVGDGPEALHLMQSSADDLDAVFMDVQLATMDGDEALRLYREWERIQRPDATPLTIFACTGNVSPPDIEGYMARGFSGVVAKPITPPMYSDLLSGDPGRVSSALVSPHQA